MTEKRKEEEIPVQVKVRTYQGGEVTPRVEEDDNRWSVVWYSVYANRWVLTIPFDSREQATITMSHSSARKYIMPTKAAKVLYTLLSK